MNVIKIGWEQVDFFYKFHDLSNIATAWKKYALGIFFLVKSGV